MDMMKIMNVRALVILGLVSLVIMTGCIGEEKKNGDIGTPSPQATPEQEVIVTPIAQWTSESGTYSGVSSSTGSMLEKYDLNKLVSMSDNVVIGDVSSILPSKWNTPDGKKPTDFNNASYTIYTDATIEVGESLKGSLSTTHITVRMLGGTVGKDVQSVEDQPSFDTNEKVLIFLKKDSDPRTKDIGYEHFTTVGLAQGKISILPNNDVIIGDEKMSLDNAKIRITGKG